MNYESKINKISIQLNSKEIEFLKRICAQVHRLEEEIRPDVLDADTALSILNKLDENLKSMNKYAEQFLI